MSPDFSFSTWFLKRRDQLVGMRASFLRMTANTSSTSSSVMTSPRPPPLGAQAAALPSPDHLLAHARFDRSERRPRDVERARAGDEAQAGVGRLDPPRSPKDDLPRTDQHAHDPAGQEELRTSVRPGEHV